MRALGLAGQGQVGRKGSATGCSGNVVNGGKLGMVRTSAMSGGHTGTKLPTSRSASSGILRKSGTKGAVG